MKNPIQISIIVTMHNAEHFIEDCLNSAICQTFSEIEILCMDGGSTDATPQILKKFKEKDARIRIINDANTSYGHKVNRGIDEAKGTYISVLESDDMYELDMLSKLYEIAETKQLDYVNADYRNFFDINGFRFYQDVAMYDAGSYNRVITPSHKDPLDLYPRYWTGLFRKSFLAKHNIRMNESAGASFQDMSFRFLTAILAESCYHLKTPVYLYRIDNPASSMHDLKKTVVIADEHNFLKNELKKRKLYDKTILFSAYQWKYMDFRGNMRNLIGTYREELFLRYLQELQLDFDILQSLSSLGFRTEVKEMLTLKPSILRALIEKESSSIRAQELSYFTFLEHVTKKAPKQELIIFGCGKNGKYAFDLLLPLQDRIACFTDNSKSLWNTSYKGHLILSPEDAVAYHSDACFIISVLHDKEEIKNQLHEMGIIDNHILFLFNLTPFFC